MISAHRLVPGRMFGMLVLGVAARVFGADFSLDFDRSTAGLPPAPDGPVHAARGAIRVARHPLRHSGDWSLELAWEQASEAPELVLARPDRGLPARGVVRFDLVIEEPGAAFRLLGRTDRGRTAFEYRIDPGGRAFGVGADGVRNEIICVSAPPKIGQWYAVRLAYDLEAGVFNLVMDSNWRSGETAGVALAADEHLAELVFMGEAGDGPALYWLDSIRLTTLDTDAPLASERMRGLTVPRVIRRETPLAGDRHKHRAAIVFPAGRPGAAAAAERVRAAVLAAGGPGLAVLSDREVTAAASRLLREEYLERPLIVLGNARDNRAMYALATRFLTRANHAWPGEDRYCVRSVLEPFRADVNWIVVEASTSGGLEAGVTALIRRIGDAPDLTLPLFRELGAASGPWAERPFRHRDLDLSGSLEEIKEQIQQLYGSSVSIAGGSLYYYDAWNWLSGAGIEAARFAAAVLLMELERNPERSRIPVGHYNFDRAVKAWQICFSAGVVDDDLIHRVEAHLAGSALNPAYHPNDWYAESIRMLGGLRMNLRATRHWTTTVSNFICGSDYVLGHVRLHPVARAIIADYHQGYLRSARRFTDSFRDMNATSEVADSNIAVLNLMALAGHGEYLWGGALARAAELYLALGNNLGYFIGEGGYIGTGSLHDFLPGRHVLGAAAFFTGDPGFQWLWQHFPGTAYGRTSHTNPAFEDQGPAQRPDRYLGVHVLPFDPRAYRALTTPHDLPPGWAESLHRPIVEPREQLFSHAVFRDGFGPEDAFLSLYGTQIAMSRMQKLNTIAQYTELGQILLFSHTQFADRWRRNAAMAGNGLPDQPAGAARRGAMLRSPSVSLFSATDPHNGNTEWTRTILRRRGGYFLVFDRFTALDDDAYAFACRWRTPHPAALDADGVWVVRAPEGVTMRLAGADPVRQESVHAEADGAFRPHILTQLRNADLAAGEGVTFRNLFYAASPARPAHYAVRSLNANNVLVRGNREDRAPEVALAGLGHTPANWEGPAIHAAVFYADATTIAAADATRVVVDGRELLDTDTPTNFVWSVATPGLGAELERAFAAAAPTPAAPLAPPTADYGFEPAWAFDDFTPAPASLPVAAIAANRPPRIHAPDSLVDPLAPLRIAQPRHVPTWSAEPEPLEITLDLGAVRPVGRIRLIGPLATGFVRRYEWDADDLSFRLSFSNDGFERDIRPIDAPPTAFRDHTFPRAAYIYSGRLPEFTIEADGQDARHVRIGIRSREETIAIQKIRVESREGDSRLSGELHAADLTGDGIDELLVMTSNRELAAFTRDGQTLWSRRFDHDIAAWNVADLESDGRPEVLVYTIDDACHAVEGDGRLRWRYDLYAESQEGPAEAWQRRHCPYTFKCLTAWRPDAQGRREVIGWTHTQIWSVRPDRPLTRIEISGSARSAVVDRAVFGREVLFMVGRDFIVYDADGEQLISRRMRGPLGGNDQFPVFTAAIVVADPRQKGFAGLNPMSVEWAPVEPAGPGWGVASEVPVTAGLAMDLTGDGVSELLVGFLDGFVRVYRLSDGQIVNRVYAGAPITGLAPLGSDLVAATRNGLRRYDARLREIGAVDLRARALVALAGATPPRIAAIDEAGRLTAFSP